MPGLLLCSVRQAHRGDPLAGVLVCRLARQALKGARWVALCSVVQCIGQPLYCSAADAGLWGERGCGDGSTRYAQLSNIALLLWLPGFPPPAFPTTISSFISPRSVSPQSTSAPTLGSLHSPQAPAPSCCAFQKALLPVRGKYGCGKTV